jgi:hypothetical protein
MCHRWFGSWLLQGTGFETIKAMELQLIKDRADMNKVPGMKK